MKKFLSLVLSLALCCSLIPQASAASSEGQQAAQSLYELGLFSGTGTDANGAPIFDLDRAPTRHEAVTMLVRLLGKGEEAEKCTWATPFTDVADWAKPYVGYAYTNGLTAGTSATTYGGDEPVTASQYITFVLRALGYETGTDFQWDKAWTFSDQIGLTDGRYNSGTATFTRGDVAIISYNSLYVVHKDAEQTLKKEDSSTSSEKKAINVPTPYMYNATGGQNSVSVSWQTVSSVSGYEIHMSTSTGGSYKLVKAVTDESSNHAIITELDAGTTYYFKVRAYTDSSSERYYSGFSTLSYAMTLAEEGFSLEIKNDLPATIKNSRKGTVAFSNIAYGTSATALGIKLSLTFSGSMIAPGRSYAAPIGTAILYERDSGEMVDSNFLFASYATEPGDSFTVTSTFHRLKDIAYILEIVPK